MTTCHVFIAASLDGFIARSNGDIDWLEAWPSIGSDYGFQDFMDSVDGLIMGRGTYEKVLSFESWPFAKPVVVMSRTLRQDEVPPHLAGKIRVNEKEPAALVQEIEGDGWKRAYVDGGQVIQSFLRAGLIHDLIVTRIPILLGSGRSLFGPLPRDVRLTHVKTTDFRSGFVQSQYQIDIDG